MLDRLRQTADQQQQAYMMARLFNPDVDPPPTLDDLIEELDTVLALPLETADDPTRQLREALGLRG